MPPGPAAHRCRSAPTASAGCAGSSPRCCPSSGTRRLTCSASPGAAQWRSTSRRSSPGAAAAWSWPARPPARSWCPPGPAFCFGWPRPGATPTPGTCSVSPRCCTGDRRAPRRIRSAPTCTGGTTPRRCPGAISISSPPRPAGPACRSCRGCGSRCSSCPATMTPSSRWPTPISCTASSPTRACTSSAAAISGWSPRPSSWLRWWSASCTRPLPAASGRAVSGTGPPP
jgi:hypothetical protein